jgi:hypothetical protein
MCVISCANYGKFRLKIELNYCKLLAHVAARVARRDVYGNNNLTMPSNRLYVQPTRHLDKEHPSFDYDSSDESDPLFAAVVNRKALHTHNHVVSRLSKYLLW